MSEKSWRQKSLTYIQQGYFEVKKEQPKLTDAEVLKIVSRDYYPFGERAYFPYQSWLKAMKQFKKALGIQSKTEAANEIQTPLFN